jgi:hypothetical protein
MNNTKPQPERVNFLQDITPDIAEFQPTPAKRPPVSRETIREVSERSNFPSREPPPARKPEPKTEQRRYRTGRNVQLSIKVRAETRDRFIAIAERHGWVMGEALDKALDALEECLARRTSE